MPTKRKIVPGQIVEVVWRDHWWDTQTTFPNPSWDEEWYCTTVGVVVENREDTLTVAHEWSLNNLSYRGVTHILKNNIKKVFVYGTTEQKIPTREGVLAGV